MATILVIESFRLLRPLLESLLIKAEYHVIAVSTAQEAIGRFSESPPDLVILDLDMPLCGGAQTARYIRRLKAGREPKILGLTHQRTREFLVTALQSGVNTILLKEECGPAMLMDRVNQLIGAAGTKRATLLAQAAAAENTSGVVVAGSAAIAAPPPTSERPAPLTKQQIDKIIPRIVLTKALRPVAQRVIAMAGNPNTDLHELSRTLRTDVGLSAKIIAAANSAYYRRKSGAVKSLSDAVSIIGLSGTRELAMSLSAADTFRTDTEEDELRLPGLWAHSISVAHLAEQLAKQLGSSDPEQAFIVGLMHEIGRRILADYLPAHYRYVLMANPTTAPSLWELEREIVGIDHAILGGIVTEHWGCPAFIAEAIRTHHALAGRDHSALKGQADLSDIVRAADAMAIALGHATDDLEELPPIDVAGMLRNINAPAEFLRAVIGSLQEIQGLIMSRVDVHFEIPKPWAGQIDQIVVCGAVANPLDPLQMTLANAYRSATVSIPAKANQKLSLTLLVCDLRAAATSPDTAAAYLELTADLPTDWPALLIAPANLQCPALMSRRLARVGPPVRPAVLRNAVGTLLPAP